MKTYDSNAPSGFKEPIWVLLAKLLEMHTIEKAYLHTIKDMKFKEKLNGLSFKEKLKEKLPTYVIEESKTGKNIPYKSKSLVDSSEKYEELFDKFDLYNYADEGEDDKFYCEMSNIEMVIENKIQQYSIERLTSNHINRVYYNLLGLIDKNIKEQHISHQAKENKKVNISFQNIYQVLNKNHESISEEYAIYKMRHGFEMSSVEYINYYKEKIKKYYIDNEIEKAKFNKFSKIICSISDLNDADFLEFSLKIMPDSQLKKSSKDYEIDLSSALNVTNLQNCFFKILKEIETEIDDVKWVYVSKNKAYLPSLINDDDDTFENRLVLNRLFNNENPELLNEVDIIITKDITIPFIRDEKIFSNIPSVDTEEGVRKRNDRITVMKKVGLMKIDDARKELDYERIDK